jgi:hypothetical protein
VTLSPTRPSRGDFARTELDVRRVHDILHCLLADDPLHLSPIERMYTGGVHDVTAWILGLPCGRGFSGEFEKVVALLEHCGIEFFDAREVVDRNPLEGDAS